MVTRESNGQWQMAWPRCYNPKPARAVEIRGAAGAVDPAEVSSRYGLLRRAHGIPPWYYWTTTHACRGRALSPPRSTPTARSCSIRRATWNGPVYSEGHTPLVLLRADRRQLRPGPGCGPAREPLAGGFRSSQAAPAVLQLRHGQSGNVLRRRRPRRGDRGREGSHARPLSRRHARLRPHGFLPPQSGQTRQWRPQLLCVAANPCPVAQATAEEIRYADEKGNLLDASAPSPRASIDARKSPLATATECGWW